MSRQCTKCLLSEPDVVFYDCGNNGKKWCRGCHREAMRQNRMRKRVAMGLPPVGVPGRTDGSTGRELTGDELIPCARCHLRGPHECLRMQTTGLGAQNWYWA